MAQASASKVTSVTGLRKDLRLSSEAETQELLKKDQLMEAFRLYRNRCLVSEQAHLASLPDWQEVDTYVYELRLSGEFRQHVRRAGIADPSGAPVDEYLAELCLCAPYMLMPHVAMFVVRVDRFLESREGKKFDKRDAARRDEGSRERAFDRSSRIMKILTFLVARDIG